MSYQKLKELFKKHGHAKIMFVGVDIGKYKHTVSVWDGYKDVLLSPYEFSSDEPGYLKMKRHLDEVIEKIKPKEIIFGCEPSGNYYVGLINKLHDEYPEAYFRLNNPKATKSQREVGMKRDKTDPIDTNAILEILTQGQTYAMPFNNPVYDEIKEVVRRIDSDTKVMVGLKNRIHSYLDELYPRFEQKGNSLIDTKSGRQFLTILPYPKRLKTMSPKELITLFKEYGYKLRPSYANKFIKRANRMLLPKSPLITTKIKSLKNLVKQYILVEEFLDESKITLETLLSHFEFTQNILEIKGIGSLTLGRIIAYLNNPFRFENGSKAAEFAGLTPSKSESGESRKREKISRIGHSSLRSEMVQCAQRVISTTGYFTAYYNRLVIERGKKINLAITATAHKLLRIIIRMIHTGEKFNPPTAENKEIALSKIPRFTKVKLNEYQKMRKAHSGTQNMLSTYLTRV